MTPQIRLPRLSRRRFIGASTAVVALGATIGTFPRIAAAAPGGPRSPDPGPMTGGTGTSWLERELSGTAMPHPCRWEYRSSGEALEVGTDGTVTVHQPGWGTRVFDAADFASGHPQELIRRAFGENVLEELRQALTGRYGGYA